MIATTRWPLAVAAAFVLSMARPAPATAQSLPACMAGPPVPIVVRIGPDPPRQAWLRGGYSPALQVTGADTAQVLWSAAASLPASQVFDALTLRFSGSLLPLDLDGDGIHDRIYAGDMGGRLWRFDLHHGETAEHWATGGVFADFSSGTRGFLAPPDVSLAEGAFRITIGTARLGAAAVDNRLYVLRDRFPFESWSPRQYERWRPLRESDLVQLPSLGSRLADPAPDGYFIVVGGADIISPTLTVSGRATLALADPGSATGAGCRVSVVVSAIDLATGSELRVPGVDGSAGSRPALSMAAGDAFTLQRESGQARCRLGQSHIPSCDADLSPRRTWWRREDAD